MLEEFSKLLCNSKMSKNFSYDEICLEKRFSNYDNVHFSVVIISSNEDKRCSTKINRNLIEILYFDSCQNYEAVEIAITKKRKIFFG